MLALALARQFLLRLAVALRINPYSLGAVDQLGLLFFVCVWLGWTIYAETRFRTAAGAGSAALKATTWRMMLGVAAPTLALGIALLLLRW